MTRHDNEKKTQTDYHCNICVSRGTLPCVAFIGGALLAGAFNPRFTVRDAEGLLASDYEYLTAAVAYAADGRIEDAIELLQGRGYERITTDGETVSSLR